ncbi:exodeoxyribonuclease III [Pseudomonas corrugata]
MKKLRIATFNINGIRARLPNLLEWLEREKPDIACLQELKALDKDFPAAELESVGYGSIWHGQASWNGVAILARDAQPLESRRGLPGDEGDSHSRYLEAAVHGVLVGCLYLPNGNPQPGPKFDYKLAWFERLIDYAQALQASDHPVVLAGDYNVVPTDMDIYNPVPGSRMRCCNPKVASATNGCWIKAGRTRCASCTRTSGSTPSGTISGSTGRKTPGCGSITCCSTLRQALI